MCSSMQFYHVYNSYNEHQDTELFTNPRELPCATPLEPPHPYCQPHPWQPLIYFPSITLLCITFTLAKKKSFNLSQRQSILTGSFSMSMGFSDLILNKFTDIFDTVKCF
ncbi:unnamed protein product [Rangifer tarandus platyrhynchus]|uniref:Uncharacterized protein n=1 Tax=Rangifer tarandus platyrhynchus TaxID=3082113 RepID=A0ABN9A5Q2_RANTA|nr:unnamed protein product [Rangifer tarandus platyrhynchus]